MTTLNKEFEWQCDDPDCVWCYGGSIAMHHPYSGPPIIYTTIVIAKHDKTGEVRVFDLGNKEFPGAQYTPRNAYTCTKEEAKKAKEKYKR